MKDHTEERETRHLRALSPRFRTRGISGTQISGGVITGKEQNPQLTGLNWVQEAEEMLRTDPIVRRSWHMLRQTLLHHGDLRQGLRVILSLKSSLDLPMRLGVLMATQGR